MNSNNIVRDVNLYILIHYMCINECRNKFLVDRNYSILKPFGGLFFFVNLIYETEDLFLSSCMYSCLINLYRCFIYSYAL